MRFLCPIDSAEERAQVKIAVRPAKSDFFCAVHVTFPALRRGTANSSFLEALSGICRQLTEFSPPARAEVSS